MIIPADYNHFSMSFLTATQSMHVMVCTRYFYYSKVQYNLLYEFVILVAITNDSFNIRYRMERLYCLLVTAFLLLSQLLVISCAFIIILDAVDIMLCVYTILSQANAILACALNIMLDAVDILLCIHTVISEANVIVSCALIIILDAIGIIVC